MRIPKEVVEEIRQRNDIVDVISGYVNLKRAGSNYNGLCPFHNEKTPSFTVFPATQTFYCFGCSESGDAISFVMKSENLEYVAAVESLAKRAGINISKEYGEDDTSKRCRRILAMNLEAAKYFRACLFDENIGKIGMDYLHKKRNLSIPVIKHFGLGFAPDGFGGLTDHLHKKGFTDSELVEGFLCGKSKKTGRTYDAWMVLDDNGEFVRYRIEFDRENER